MKPSQFAGGASTNANRRAFWLRQLRQWHWISAAVSLLGTLVFAATGITLNHASQIEAKPAISVAEKTLPADLLGELKATPGGEILALPPSVAGWLKNEMGITAAGKPIEASAEELYISLPRPGGDAWVSIDLEEGAVRYENTDRGWVSYLNDLHKGRNTGPAWSLFIDVFAVACIFFSLTGLALLQLYGFQRPMTWPLVGLGCFLPILIAVFLIH